jgi:uncharacterized RDD family membrane protein YckC
VPLVLIIALMGPQPGTTDGQFASGFIGVILFLGPGSLAYGIGVEASAHQATLGKIVVGAIIMRNTLGKMISSFTPFYISYLMGLARKDRRCLHALMAGTMVCEKSKAAASCEQTFA